MGKACSKEPPKLTRDISARLAGRRQEALRNFLELIYLDRRRRLDEEADTLPADIGECLAALFNEPHTSAKNDLQDVYAAYDNNGSGTWTRDEARTFFLDCFAHLLEVALPLHIDLVVRDRLRDHRMEDNAQARRRVTEICSACMDKGLVEARSKIRNREYLFESTLFKLVDQAQDGLIHLKECLDVMIDGSLEFERMYITCLGLDHWILRARCAADEWLFGPCKVIDVDVHDTPRQPEEGREAVSGAARGAANPYYWDSAASLLFLDADHASPTGPTSVADSSRLLS